MARLRSILGRIRRGVTGRDRQTLVFRPFYLSREFIRPSIPDMVGMRAFRNRSSWGFNPSLCPCDAHFIEYLDGRQVRDPRIFHFGTGAHHMVGLWAHRRAAGSVLGVTSSVKEHEAYATLVLADTALAKRYQVLFSDIYVLRAVLLPMFDCVTLFHLGEFTPSTGDREDPDASLVDLMLSRLVKGGRMMFYKGSFGWNRSKAIIDARVASGQLRHVEIYRSLLIYEKMVGVDGASEGRPAAAS